MSSVVKRLWRHAREVFDALGRAFSAMPMLDYVPPRRQPRGGYLPGDVVPESESVIFTSGVMTVDASKVARRYLERSFARFPREVIWPSETPDEMMDRTRRGLRALADMPPEGALGYLHIAHPREEAEHLYELVLEMIRDDHVEEARLYQLELEIDRVDRLRRDDGKIVSIKQGCGGAYLDVDDPANSMLPCACTGYCQQRILVPERHAMFHILALDLAWAASEGKLGVQSETSRVKREGRPEW